MNGAESHGNHSSAAAASHARKQQLRVQGITTTAGMKDSINGVGAQIVRGATNPAALESSGYPQEGRTSDLNKIGSLSCAYSSVGEL